MKVGLPEEGVEWLARRLISRQIKDGPLDLNVQVRDFDGELLALSRHVAMRWRGRSTGKKGRSSTKAALCWSVRSWNRRLCPVCCQCHSKCCLDVLLWRQISQSFLTSRGACEECGIPAWPESKSPRAHEGRNRMEAGPRQGAHPAVCQTFICGLSNPAMRLRGKHAKLAGSSISGR